MCKLFKEISFSLQIEFGDELVIKSQKTVETKLILKNANSWKYKKLNKMYKYSIVRNLAVDNIHIII